MTTKFNLAKPLKKPGQKPLELQGKPTKGPLAFANQGNPGNTVNVGGIGGQPNWAFNTQTGGYKRKTFENQNPFQMVGGPGAGQAERFDSSGYQQNPFEYDRNRYAVGNVGRAGLGDFRRFEDQAMESYMRHLAPQLESDRRAFEQRMVGRGITDENSEAYRQAFDNFTRAQNDARSSAAFGAMQFGLGAQGQDFGQRLAQAEFGAQRARDVFGRDLTAQSYNNDLVNQAFGRDMSAAGFNNQAGAQDFAQRLADAQFRQSEQGRQFGQGLAYDTLNAQDLASQRGLTGSLASANAAKFGAQAAADASRYGADLRNQLGMSQLGEQGRQFDLGFGEGQRQFDINDAFRSGQADWQNYFGLGNLDLGYRQSELDAARLNAGLDQQGLSNYFAMTGGLTQPGIQPLDVMGAYGLNQNAQQNAYGIQAQNAQRNRQGFYDMVGSVGTAAFLSSRTAKHEVGDVDSDAILTALEGLDIKKWVYIGDTQEHIGPYAEDFNAAIGREGPAINIADAVGALLAATKALAAKVRALEHA